MMTTYITGQPGSAMGIPHIISAIKEFKDHLLVVIRVKHPDNFSFIAIFREKGSIGSFTALIDQQGATSGYNGGGPWAHAQMLTFLEENNIKLEDAYWNNWQRDYPEFTSQLDKIGLDGDYTGELSELWSKFLSHYIWYFLPKISYEPSNKCLSDVGY